MTNASSAHRRCPLGYDRPVSDRDANVVASYDRVAGAVDTLVETYLRERHAGERFLNTFRRTGVAPFKEAVYADVH